MWRGRYLEQENKTLIMHLQVAVHSSAVDGCIFIVQWCVYLFCRSDQLHSEMYNFLAAGLSESVGARLPCLCCESWSGWDALSTVDSILSSARLSLTDSYFFRSCSNILLVFMNKSIEPVGICGTDAPPTAQKYRSRYCWGSQSPSCATETEFVLRSSLLRNTAKYLWTLSLIK